MPPSYHPYHYPHHCREGLHIALQQLLLLPPVAVVVVAGADAG